MGYDHGSLFRRSHVSTDDEGEVLGVWTRCGQESLQTHGRKGNRGNECGEHTDQEKTREKTRERDWRVVGATFSGLKNRMPLPHPARKK